MVAMRVGYVARCEYAKVRSCYKIERDVEYIVKGKSNLV
jgi:hypothetical protein